MGLLDENVGGSISGGGDRGRSQVFINSTLVRLSGNTDIAYLLVRLGRIDGLLFLIRVLKSKSQTGMILDDEVSIKGLDTASALEQITGVMYFAVEPRYVSIPPPHNPAAVLMGWLRALAGKSEVDLLSVLNFLQRMEVEWRSQYPDGAKSLRWHAINLSERLRAAQEGSLSVDEIRSFLNRREVVAGERMRPTQAD